MSVDIETKCCTKCQKVKNVDLFRKVRNKVGSWCVACCTESSKLSRSKKMAYYREAWKAHYDKNRERYRLEHKAYNEKNKTALNAKAMERNLKLRAEMFKHLGDVCACCGETEQKFLTFEHLRGGGHTDRKTSGGVYGVLRKAKRLGWPKSEYAVLCYNCNLSAKFTGICPHKLLKVKNLAAGADQVFNATNSDGVCTIAEETTK